MIASWLIILCLAIYIIRVLIIKIAAKAHRNKHNAISATTETPFVSVVVPARNEENNIANCINSILKSNYPTQNYEIIIVNDRSTDNTAKIVADIAQSSPVSINLRNITAEAANPNLKGKPGAIKHGIDAAKGDIIMMTDADCAVQPNWITHTAQHFIDGKPDNIGMVCAYTNVKTKNIFHYFQAAEWAYMHTYACAGIGLNTVLGCFGNNISITKQAYNAIGGFDNLAFSVTEDYVLLKSIFEAGYSIRYLCTKDTACDTLPVDTFKEYLTQRKRWAVGGLNLKWKAFAYVFSSLCIWIAGGLSILNENWFLLFCACVLRLLGDCLILFPIFNILEIKYIKKWIPLSVCFYTIIELLLPFMLVNRKVRWKGQVFNE